MSFQPVSVSVHYRTRKCRSVHKSRWQRLSSQHLFPFITAHDRIYQFVTEADSLPNCDSIWQNLSKSNVRVSFNSTMFVWTLLQTNDTKHSPSHSVHEEDYESHNLWLTEDKEKMLHTHTQGITQYLHSPDMMGNCRLSSWCRVKYNILMLSPLLKNMINVPVWRQWAHDDRCMILILCTSANDTFYTCIISHLYNFTDERDLLTQSMPSTHRWSRHAGLFTRHEHTKAILSTAESNSINPRQNPAVRRRSVDASSRSG